MPYNRRVLSALVVSALLGGSPVPVFAADAGGSASTVVFRSGDEGYHSFRIPAVIVTKQGTVLAFCEGRKKSRSDSGDIDLVLKRSADGGRTWGPLQVVADHGSDTIGNPCPVVDQSTGTVWLPLTGNRGDEVEKDIKAGTSKGSRTVWITHSTDDGKTWAAPVEITADAKKPTWRWYATGPGEGIQLRHGPHKGRLVIPCDHSDGGDAVSGAEDKDGSAAAHGSHVIYSDDAGKSWKLGGVVGPGMNESTVAERRDGSLLLNMRTHKGLTEAQRRRAISTSADGGVTWSKVSFDDTLIEPVCQASLLRVDDPKRPDRRLMLFSNPAGKDKRAKMTVRLSEDDGTTWAASKLLHDGPAAYSCLTVLADGTVGCLYERGEKGAYETITFERFNLGDLRSP